MDTFGPRIGRETEKEQIRQAAHQAAQRRFQVVYLEGFAGVGKATLLRDARESNEDWREIVIVLDQQKHDLAGDLLRRLVLPSEAVLNGQSVDVLVAEGLRRAPVLRRPTVISLIDVQWIDDESAEALLRLCILLREAAVLLVMSGRPSARPEVNRLSAFARNSPNGTYIRVDPLQAAETKELLGQYLTTPISRGVVEAVQLDTSGYPVLVHEVGRSLAAATIGSRRLAFALASAKAGRAAHWMRRAFEEALAPLSAETIEVLKVLAVSSVPLARRQISQVLDSPADLSDVLESGLAGWDERHFGYRIHGELIGETLLELMCPLERVGVHRALMHLGDETQGLHHRVQIAQILPEAEPREALTRDLRAAASESLRRGDLEAAFQHCLAVAGLEPDAAALHDLLRLGVSLGHLDCFTAFESSIRRLLPGALRQAGLALVGLDRDDLRGAVAALEQQERLDEQDPAALTYAHAVALVSAQLGISGLAGRALSVKQVTRSMLAHKEKRLEQVLQAEHQSDGARISLEWERAQAAGLGAFIRLWQVFDGQDPRKMRRAEEDISREIERLETIPQSRIFEVGLLAARGARLRQLGDPVAAHADLSTVMMVSQDAPFFTFARAQLAQVLFMAGLWDESKDVAASAAGRVLLGREDATALVAHLTWALVPVGRGQYADVEPMIAEITAVRRESGVLVSAGLERLHAWKAVVESDHEQAVKHLLRLRDESGGWWNVGVDSMLLLVRAAHFADLDSLIPPLQRGVANGDIPVSAKFQDTVTDYMEGFQAWGVHDPVAAMARFMRVYERLDAQPSNYTGHHVSEFGGHRLFKAFNFLDMGTLISAYPHELKRHRSTVVEGLERSAALFNALGSPGLLQMAIGLLSVLRGRLAATVPQTLVVQAQETGRLRSSGTRSAEALPDRTQVVADADGAGVLERLSGRERQVAVLIADGWTNKEIAEALGVSVRTVDFHVRNALTKFDVSSRHEIRHRLRGASPGG